MLHLQPASLRLPMYLSPLAGAALGLCLSCATAASSQLTSPNPTAAWTLTFEMSGGIAGFDRRLELASTGHAAASDRRRKLTRAARVAEAELTTIGSLVAAARSIDARSPGCNDCLEYAVDIQARSTRVTVRGNDTGLAGADSAKLVNALSQLLTRILSGEAQ